jgi:hypothetical protein
VLAQQGIYIDILAGVDPKVAQYIDAGLSRKFGEKFTAGTGKDRKSNKYYNRLGSFAKICIASMEGRKATNPPFDQLRDFVIQHEESLHAVSTPFGFEPADRIPCRAAFALYFMKNPENAAKFFKMVTGLGENLGARSPAILLRNFLMALSKVSKDAHTEQTKSLVFQTTLWACRAFENKDRVTQVSQLRSW